MNIADNKNYFKKTLAMQDIIDERLKKTKAILESLLATWDNNITLNHDTIYSNIWTAYDFLQEIDEHRNELA